MSPRARPRRRSSGEVDSEPEAMQARLGEVAEPEGVRHALAEQRRELDAIRKVVNE
jgi:hypothetical protein